MRPGLQLKARLREWLRWLIPGMGVKRWFGLQLLGTTLVGLGLAYLLIDFYRDVAMPWLPGVLTLQFLPRAMRGLLLGGLGLALTLLAIAQINRNVLAPFVRPGQSVAQAVSEHRRRGRGPKIVAIGGGTGLSTLLRGLKAHTSNLTAIVTVADDGGSSGRLRQTLGVLPPGDFRNCIAALADDEALTTQLFQYRFGGREDVGGHSFGNLFITAMAEVAGSFEKGLLESSKVLNIRGRVVPSTLSDVTLIGEVVGEGQAVAVVTGESKITETRGQIRRVRLQPEDPPAYPGAVRALLEADLIVLGPGSLYTSLLPNLLVPDLTAAIKASRALKVYVCNTATQPGETDGYSVLDHVRAIERHTERGLFPLVLANVNQRGTLLPHLNWVTVDAPANGALQVIAADLADAAYPWRHDATKLAAVLISLLETTDYAIRTT
ncbi:MAG: YvcK family protein [Anaerolineales bacterium]|nr:YvcK family protein [Anaerolineales bacterium]